MKIVIALGGNALQSKDRPPTPEAQLDILRSTAKYLADIYQQGNEILIVHGNGPQVGRIMLSSELSADTVPLMPFDVCVAMSQGYIGYHIQQALREELAVRGVETQVVSLVTQMVVDADDEAFRCPTKPIGQFYSEEKARQLSLEKGYAMKEDSGRGWRRVVPSPLPREIVEADTIRSLYGKTITICCGGGGVPVVRSEDGLEGVAAVIDKDHAAGLLAELVDADMLLILTEVENAAINFGKENQRNLGRVSTEEMRGYIEQGHFGSGSMLPKILSAVRFAESGNNKRAVITSLGNALRAVNDGSGTVVYSSCLAQ